MLSSRSFARTKWFDNVSKFLKSEDSQAVSVEFSLVDGSTLSVRQIWTEDDHLRLEVYDQGEGVSLRILPYERIAQVIVRRQVDSETRCSFTLTEEAH